MDRNAIFVSGISSAWVCSASTVDVRKACMAVKRGYSREFRPHGDTGKRYLLDDIPAGLWTDVKAKAKREGVSLRALILSLLRDWLAAPSAGEGE
jgi:hypothetical protein